MTIACQPNAKYRVTHFERKRNHELATAVAAHSLPSQKRIAFDQAIEAESTRDVLDEVPKLGLAFVLEGHAYEFYNAYARHLGFSIRNDYVNSKKDGTVVSRRFTCYREGFRKKDKRDVKRARKETSIGCLAQLIIARQVDDRFCITYFEDSHNHELVALGRVHMLHSQKGRAKDEALEASEVDGSGRKHKSALELSHGTQVTEQVNNSVAYDPIDYKSKLPPRCMRDMKQGEAEGILQYFQSKVQKDPSLFCSVQLDAEEQISNFFWADAEMLVDYSDVIGVNHHKQIVVSGAALLYDQTVESFKWLFQAVTGKKPKTILSDQDAALIEAINFFFSETPHRLCAWHVYQYSLKQASQVTLDLESFGSDLGSCIFNHDEEDFVESWKVILDTYGLLEE